MIINVQNLKKRYKNHDVLKEVDIAVDESKIIALVGPNGAGKTTLLNCMTNLISCDEGEIELLGKKNNDPSLFYDVSYLQDNRILYGNLTGLDHLKFVCDMQEIAHSEIIKAAERVGVESYLKKKVSNYSLGMKQHLLLTMAIINRPKLLLMDEPLNGLDPTSAINMRNILLDMHQEGTTIFISSHNLDEIDKLTDTIYFMKDGELVKESLQSFATDHYIISTDNFEKAKAILNDSNHVFSVKDETKIEFNEENILLSKVIQLLTNEDVTITDIEKEKIGAEKRYRELFEGNTSV